MKKKILFLIISLLAATYAYCQSPEEFIKCDGVEADSVINMLNGNWQALGYSRLDLSYYSNAEINHFTKALLIFDEDKANILSDTFRHPEYTIEKVNDKEFYLKSEYNIECNTQSKSAYRIYISSKILPDNIVNNNKNYIYSQEFLLFGGNIFYDKDGVIIKYNHIKNGNTIKNKNFTSSSGSISIKKKFSNDKNLQAKINDYHKLGKLFIDKNTSVKYYNFTMKDEMAILNLKNPNNPKISYYISLPDNDPYLKTVLMNGGKSYLAGFTPVINNESKPFVGNKSFFIVQYLDKSVGVLFNSNMLLASK